MAGVYLAALVVLLVVAVLIYWHRNPRPIPVCPKCGGETEWYEGMGAGFDLCTKCGKAVY